MAKEKKNRKKGIVDPRKAERAKGRAAAAQGKAESDADTATKAYRANKIAKAIASEKPETETTAEVTPPASVPQLDEDVKLGYAGRPIPRGERPVAKLDAADVADDAAQAAIIREDDERQAKIESGEVVKPRTPLDVVRGIQERRAAAEQERVAGKARVDLPSAVDTGFDEVTEGEVVRRSAGRTARRGTGLVDFGNMAGGGRGRAGLTEEQTARAAGRAEGRKAAEEKALAGADPVRRSAAEEVFGGAVEPLTAGERYYTDKPEIMDLARRLKTADLMDQGKEVTPEAVEDGLQGGHHQRLARVIHHTGLSADEVHSYLGGRQSIAHDKLNEFHETVMTLVRSRRKSDVLPRMGLVRNEDGGFTPTEVAQSQDWQHPTEKDANGLPKTYKVSDMHPDMVRQLNHPWGGSQSENEFEGTSVVRETPAIPGKAEKNPSLRYQIANMRSAGDYLPVSIRFGHSKNAAGAWSFTPPPEGFEKGETGPYTSNVTHITDAIREGRTRSSGTRKSHAEVANNLIAELDPAKQRVIGQRQVAVPMPGFTQDGSPSSKTAYEPMVTDVPHAGEDSMVMYDDLPHVKDSNGNLVPLAPRAGKAGTGRSVHVVQGTMGMGQQFTSPAEESAKTLMGFEVTPATEKTRTRKLKDGTEKVTTRQIAGVASNVAEGAMADGERSSQTRRLVRGNRAVGKQFMGVEGVEPRYRAKQGVIPGFENYGNTELQRGIPAVVDTKFAEGPLPESADTRSEAGLVERTTRLNAQPSQTINTGISDSRIMRSRAEAESGRGVIGAVEQPAPKAASDYTQPELDFNPSAPGVTRTRQFMLGTVRPLTESEKSVENVGANTIRGMNPPARNFDVGAPTATAAVSTTQPAVSSGEVELSKRGGGRRGLAKGEKVQGTDVVVNSTKGPKKRALKRPPNSAALAE